VNFCAITTCFGLKLFEGRAVVQIGLGNGADIFILLLICLRMIAKIICAERYVKMIAKILTITRLILKRLLVVMR
jgi:preprotein translocase subunit SecY